MGGPDAGSTLTERTNETMSAQRGPRAATSTTGSSTPRRDGAAAPRRPRSEDVRPPLPTPRPAAPRPAAAPATRPAGAERGKTPTQRVAVEGRLEPVRRLYRDTMSEMRKVVWPDRETTKNLTLVVIGISVVLGVLLGGIDFLLQAVFAALP